MHYHKKSQENLPPKSAQRRISWYSGPARFYAVANQSRPEPNTLPVDRLMRYDNNHKQGIKEHYVEAAITRRR
jgi:hypothetical protein